ncbi:MAG: type II secretion system F family protein [Clostridiaceae bacterium]|nr:type II secretion system F family protein [Clostridiaceae bacterium]
MSAYQYKAISTSGEAIEGSLVAKDRSEVLEMLREKDYKPVTISEIRENQDINLKSAFKRIKLKDIGVFCRQFYTMLNSGISIIQCLDILRQQFDNIKLRKVIADVYELVQKGSSFSESLRVHKDVFPELLINMVEAGEASGNLDVIMERMAEHFEKDTKLKRKVTGAMIYPIVLSCVCVVVVIFLLTFIMPTFIGMFTSSGVALPLPTQILLNISFFLRDWWYLLAAAVIVAVYLIRRSLKTESGRLAFDRFKLRIPVIKNVTIRIATTRFTRTLSTLLASGIPLLNAMEITSRVVGNKVVEKAILSIREDVRKGFDLAGPVKKTNLFPPMVDSMIKIGEESGSLDDVLRKTADFYDEEVDASVQKMTSMLEPLLIVFMAVIIGAVIISIAMPMFSMFTTVQ